MKSWSVLFAIVAGMMASGPTHASLVSLDSSFGAASLTFDTDTRLEWLDLTETAGLSYNQVTALLAPGASLEGFRYASIDELDTLMANAGIPVRGLTWHYGEDAARVLALLDLLNEKTTVGAERQAQGILGEKPFAWQADSFRAVGFLLWLDGPTPGLSPSEYPAGQASPGRDATAVSTGTAQIGVGSFLVREAAPVPEPASWLLVLLGLAVLGVHRARAKRGARG